MKRLWFGVGLLAVMLGLGLFSSWSMEKLQNPVSEALEQAAETALTGDFQEARQQAENAFSLWEKNWPATAAMADHEPMDEIDGLFAKLDSYAEAENRQEFAACCAQIGALVEAVADAHGLNWWNLL